MASKSWFSKLKHIVVKAHGSRPLKNSTEKKTPAQSPKEQEDFLRKRASQYIPSEERKERPLRSPINTKASDTCFPADLPPSRKSKRRPRKVAAKPCTGAGNWSCKSEAIVPKKIKESEVTEAATSGCKYEPGRSKSEAATSSYTPEAAPELKQLPPILTKAPAPKKEKAANDTPGDERETAGRRSVSVSGSHRIKVRRSSPRIESKKIQYASKPAMQKNKKKKKKSMTELSESLVMIKSSSNPWRDFADSMLEMIVENDIRGAKDLEELLACYLSLNSQEYHEVIINVFEHIWFALTDVRTM